MIKVSIITAVLNRRSFIEDCINSVAGQNYPSIEHIVIDGASTDGTLDILKKRQGDLSCLVSEPDRGLYDAMNKGITCATGDVIGILNSDDMYASHDVISRVAQSFRQSNADSCYGDLTYVDRRSPGRVIRYWRAGDYFKKNFRRGWMPPHPTFFVKRKIYEKYGLFNLDFRLAADYELMLRFLYRHEVSTAYIPGVLVQMRTGGICRPRFSNIVHNMAENYRAWTTNGLWPNPLTFILKPLSKAVQYI